MAVCFFVSGCASTKSSEQTINTEQHRPQFHFSPPSNWMNDPNGMVYYQGEYHLFYQYHPKGNTWGPMHWGHAVTKDLVHWEHLPIALYPDSLGMIFSGSAVVDHGNTSGLGTKENPAMVAIFTSAGKKQQQSIAFSIDRGRTWSKYEGNPVLENQGIDDFRDPKVMWLEKEKKWIMTLAVADHISFYSSPNLKEWRHESDFGADIGGHGGVWECPDLFKMPVAGTKQDKWVLLVSINPGGPNGGSATQYFVGDFNGKELVLDEQFQQQLSITTHVPSGKVFASFDGKEFGGWRTEGSAFGNAPVAGTLPNQHKVMGYFGQGLVNSYHQGDQATGKLTSPEFEIDSDYINMLVGGGRHPEGTGVRLLVGGEVVRKATGNNTESLNWLSWNTKELKGKKARIEVFDNVTGGWGHILVDQIILSAEPAKERKEAFWLDYGPDNYAGVTWANVPDSDGRRLFLGWMSNWLYANNVPTTIWRSAMTVPRELSLQQTQEGIRLVNLPVKELQKLRSRSITIKQETVNGTIDLSQLYGLGTPLLELDLHLNVSQAQRFELKFANTKGEYLSVGYSIENQELYIDRSNAGKIGFSDSFPGRHSAPLKVENGELKLQILLDVSSIEVFANGGKTAMTEIFFPNEDFTKTEVISTGTTEIKKGKIYTLKSVWKQN
ncbi:glycoside hydrolase family 32 protein [Rufibacter roseus]|uniref:Glycoside hydrolase family 32 protein n=1 Tax=Rufibacter roseus TaxID=1567108 RepID=A0ABW2DHC3_9BACT